MNPGAGLSVTVKALAVDAEGSTGSVSSATVQGPAVPVPTISAVLTYANPNGENQYTVTMTVASPATQIHYSVNVGGASNSTLYTSPVTIYVDTGFITQVTAFGTTAQGANSSTTSIQLQGGTPSGGGGGGGGGCIVQAPGKSIGVHGRLTTC